MQYSNQPSADVALVDRACRSLPIQHGNQTLDLPPTTKMNVIADVATGFGTARGLIPRFDPEMRNQGLRLADIIRIYKKRNLVRQGKPFLNLGRRLAGVWPACVTANNKAVWTKPSAIWLPKT